MSTGSGIFAPDGPKTYYFDMESQNGHLLLAELDSRPRLSPSYPPPVNWSMYASSVNHFLPERQVFTGEIYFDEFTFTKLSQDAGNCTVCQKGLCCHLSYKMAEKQNDEVYAFGAFDGLHVIEGEYYLQVRNFSEVWWLDWRNVLLDGRKLLYYLIQQHFMQSLF